MHPGSGPSDRDNDVYFPPIREHLLGAGIAVCSFDKRGVGGSTGCWQEAAIEAQAEDVLAAVETLLADDVVGAPIGFFGHSQGGWVVVEAASRSSDVAFVVSNSGPGVSPGEQERYSTQMRLERDGASAREVVDGLRSYDALLEMLRDGVPLEAVRDRLDASGLSVPGDFDLAEEADWGLMRALVDYDPRPALERIEVPVLALFGGDDAIVPVEPSIAVYRDAVRPELLTTVVFPGADHRVQAGDPPRLADGYLDALAAFIGLRSCECVCHSYARGRLAQPVEHLLYTQGVAGSSPAPPISQQAPVRVRLNYAMRFVRSVLDVRLRAVTFWSGGVVARLAPVCAPPRLGGRRTQAAPRGQPLGRAQLRVERSLICERLLGE